MILKTQTEDCLSAIINWCIYKGGIPMHIFWRSVPLGFMPCWLNGWNCCNKFKDVFEHVVDFIIRCYFHCLCLFPLFVFFFFFDIKIIRIIIIRNNNNNNISLVHTEMENKKMLNKYTLCLTHNIWNSFLVKCLETTS